MEPSAGDNSVGAVGSALPAVETKRRSVSSLVMLALSVERMFIGYDIFPIVQDGVKVIVKVVSPPEVEVLVLQILLMLEGGFNTEIMGATPLSSVDVNVKVLVVPIETVCVVLSIPVIAGGSFEALAVLKKKSTGIYDFTDPLSYKSSTIITATQRSSTSFTSFWLHPEHKTVSLTSQETKPEELNVIPVGSIKLPLLLKNSAFVPQR